AIPVPKWRLRKTSPSPGPDLPLAGDALGEAQGLLEIGVAQDHVAVRDPRTAPVPSNRAERLHVHGHDRWAELGAQPVQALDVPDPPLPQGPLAHDGRVVGA